MENQATQYGQMDFFLPHDVVQLPSKGVFYKNKKKSLKVGYLTAADENILMAGGNDLTINLLRSKIYEPDIRVEELLEGDVEAILIFLRNTAFGPEMTLNLVDPITRKQFQTNVMLDQLPIVEGQIPTEDGTFVFRLPKSETTVKAKPLSYGEIMELRKMEESYPQGRTVPKVTWRLQKEIVEVNGTTSKEDIVKFIETMPIADSKEFRKMMDKNEPRLDLRKTVLTPSGEQLTVNVGFGVDFFRPFF